MTDKELIKKETERLKNHTLNIQKSEDGFVTSVGRGRVEAFNDILKFIDSLPEESEFTEIEKRVVDSWTVRIDNKRIPITLKGDIKAKFRNEFHTMWQIVGEMQFANVAKAIIEKLCLHFAAWGAYNLKGLGDINKEEKAKMDIPKEHNEDLEEEITKCYKSRNDLMMTRKQFGELIHHFAEWQRNQMMKDAVDALVNTYENTDDSNYVEFVTEQSPYKFKETEKCKLIIIKEE